MEEPEGLQRVRADAQRRGLAIEVRDRPRANSLEEAAELLGVTPNDIAKTIVMRAGADRFLLAVVPGDGKVAFPKVRELMGTNKLKFPSAEEALEVTGFAHGTINPLGTTTSLPVYVDSTLAGRRVAMGSGSHQHAVLVDVDALVAATGATLTDLLA